MGGSGDIVANVFVLAQALDPTTPSVSAEFSNERNTLGMHGSGAIEMLAREMTIALQAQAATLADGNRALVSKGVEFEVTIANGTVVASEGVDTESHYQTLSSGRCCRVCTGIHGQCYEPPSWDTSRRTV